MLPDLPNATKMPLNSKMTAKIIFFVINLKYVSYIYIPRMLHL